MSAGGKAGGELTSKLTSLHHDMALMGASCFATGVGCMAPLASAQRMAMLSAPHVKSDVPSLAQSTPSTGALALVAAAATCANVPFFAAPAHRHSLRVLSCVARVIITHHACVASATSCCAHVVSVHVATRFAFDARSGFETSTPPPTSPLPATPPRHPPPLPPPLHEHCVQPPNIRTGKRYQQSSPTRGTHHRRPTVGLLVWKCSESRPLIRYATLLQ